MKKQAQKLFNYFPVVLLVLIALHQQYQAHVKDLSPWKGGGFGMFSTYDSPGARFVQAFLVLEDDTLSVKIPGRYKKSLLRIKTLPTKNKLESIAAKLLQEDWVDYGNISYSGSQQKPLSEEVPLTDEMINNSANESLKSINSEDPRSAKEEPSEIILKGNTVRYVDVKKKGKNMFSEAKDIQPLGALLILWKLEFLSEGPKLKRNKSIEVFVQASPKKNKTQ